RVRREEGGGGPQLALHLDGGDSHGPDLASGVLAQSPGPRRPSRRARPPAAALAAPAARSVGGSPRTLRGAVRPGHAGPPADRPLRRPLPGELELRQPVRLVPRRRRARQRLPDLPDPTEENQGASQTPARGPPPRPPP